MKLAICESNTKLFTDSVYPPDEGDGDESGAIPDEWEDSWQDPTVFPLMASNAIS